MTRPPVPARSARHPRTATGRPIRGLCLALALLAAACSGGEAPAGEASDGVRTAEGSGEGSGSGEDATIDVTLFGGPEEVAGYTRLAEDFEAANPGVRVALNPVASQDDLLANLTTSFAGGQPPDVFLANYLRYGQFAAEGVLADVGPYLDDSAVIAEDDFAEPALDAFRFDGEALTCMPQNISSLVVYYNVDLFEAAGLDAPAAGWGWQDLLDAATALTDPSNGQYGVGVEPSLQRLAPLAWSAGGELTDDPERPTTLTLDDPGTRTALDWLLDLQLVHEVAPPDVEEQSLEAEERFIAGQLGMYLDSRRPTPTLRTGITGFEWDVAPMPIAPGGTPTTILHGDAYCMAADADPDLAWRFVEHAMTADGQTILAESGRTVPSRLDVARSPAFLEPDAPPASAEVFLDAIPTIRALPGTATWSQMQREVDSLLTDVYYGRIDRDAGIADMVTTAEAIMAQGQ